MCLDFDKKELSLFKKTGKIPGVRIRTDKNGRKFFYGYKIINYYNCSIFFPYYYGVGINKSGRKSKELTCDEKKLEEVGHGIHVFFTKKKAYRSYWYLGRKAISCRCYLQHLVAFNDKEAVLTQVEVTSLKDVLTAEQRSLYYHT